MACGGWWRIWSIFVDCCGLLWSFVDFGGFSWIWVDVMECAGFFCGTCRFQWILVFNFGGICLVGFGGFWWSLVDVCGFWWIWVGLPEFVEYCWVWWIWVVLRGF